MHAYGLTWRGGRIFSDDMTNPWCLQAGTAQTWVAPCSGRLVVMRGRVWVSCDAPSGQASDHILGAHEALQMSAGQRIVIESWAIPTTADAWLRWAPS